jgi:hypothetical protein
VAAAAAGAVLPGRTRPAARRRHGGRGTLALAGRGGGRSPPRSPRRGGGGWRPARCSARSDRGRVIGGRPPRVRSPDTHRSRGGHRFSSAARSTGAGTVRPTATHGAGGRASAAPSRPMTRGGPRHGRERAAFGEPTVVGGGQAFGASPEQTVAGQPTFAASSEPTTTVVAGQSSHGDVFDPTVVGPAYGQPTLAGSSEAPGVDYAAASEHGTAVVVPGAGPSPYGGQAEPAGGGAGQPQFAESGTVPGSAQAPSAEPGIAVGGGAPRSGAFAVGESGAVPLYGLSGAGQVSGAHVGPTRPGEAQVPLYGLSGAGQAPSGAYGPHPGPSDAASGRTCRARRRRAPPRPGADASVPPPRRIRRRRSSDGGPWRSSAGRHTAPPVPTAPAARGGRTGLRPVRHGRPGSPNGAPSARAAQARRRGPRARPWALRRTRARRRAGAAGRRRPRRGSATECARLVDHHAVFRCGGAGVLPAGPRRRSGPVLAFRVRLAQAGRPTVRGRRAPTGTGARRGGIPLFSPTARQGPRGRVGPRRSGPTFGVVRERRSRTGRWRAGEGPAFGARPESTVSERGRSPGAPAG